VRRAEIEEEGGGNGEAHGLKLLQERTRIPRCAVDIAIEEVAVMRRATRPRPAPANRHRGSRELDRDETGSRHRTVEIWLLLKKWFVCER